jgi:hypothetical protein
MVRKTYTRIHSLDKDRSRSREGRSLSAQHGCLGEREQTPQQFHCEHSNQGRDPAITPAPPRIATLGTMLASPLII